MQHCGMQILYPLNHIYFADDEQEEKWPIFPVFPHEVAKILHCSSPITCRVLCQMLG